MNDARRLKQQGLLAGLLQQRRDLETRAKICLDEIEASTFVVDTPLNLNGQTIFVAASPLEGVRMDPAQVRLLDDEGRVVVVCWHRQKGKDFTSARKAVRHAMKTGESWYIVSITQRQADETFAKCKLWARHLEAKFDE